MGNHRKLWVAYHHLKLFTAFVLLTPISKFMPVSQETRIKINFFWLVSVLLLSPFFRFYREYYVANEKSKI